MYPKWYYMTYWFIYLEAVFFCLCLVDDAMQGKNKSGKTPFKGILDYSFTTFVIPTSLCVVLTFWGLYAIDAEYVFQRAAVPFIPWYQNLTLHLFNGVYPILELFTTYHCLPSLYASIAGLLAILITYVSWLHVIFFRTGNWVYPVLSKLNFPFRTLLFMQGLVSSTCFLLGSRYATNVIWKSRVEEH